MARRKKRKALWVDGIPIAPITSKERKRLDRLIGTRNARYRRKYPEVHGKVVDFVTQSIEDGTLYVGIRFQDKTDFSLRYACDVRIVGADLCDASSGDYELIREYVRPIRR